MTALPDEGIQFSPQRQKVGQLALHVCKVLAGYRVHRFSRFTFVVGKGEQCSNLLDGKAEVARAAREGKAADMLG
jgi:hypothetical protein